MPSYLGNYPNAASLRDEKFIRAVQSVINQRYKHWELIIVADGCDKTRDLCEQFAINPKIRGFYIPKQPMWSGTPRNVGIVKAKNEYIIYLDIDDVYVEDYLLSLSEEMKERHMWYFVNDIIWSKDKFIERHCDPNTLTMCGTSNIIHRRDMNVIWQKRASYKHDWYFIKLLSNKAAPIRLKSAGYKVMHTPYQYDI